MARYIDAELLKKHGFVLAKVKTDKDGEVTEFMTLQVDDAPTADVVPKSEVDWHREAELNAKRIMELEAELSNAKQEVAREIFEEIENFITNEYLTAKDSRDIEGYVKSSVHYGIAELKKRYMEENSNERL